MQSILKSVFVNDLFEKGNDYFIEFKSGSNCLFGDNGTGKTTLIELIVASLQCAIPTIMKINFSHISLNIESNTGEEKTISIYKYSSEESKKLLQEDLFNTENDDIDDEFSMFNNLGKNEKFKTDTAITYQIDNEEYTFSIPEYEAKDFYLKKIFKSRLHITITNKLRSIVSLTHVPLLRLYQDEDSLRTLYESRRNAVMNVNPFEIDDFADPSLLVLKGIESKFKRIAKDNNTLDTKKLETFKSKIIEKFLLDSADFSNLPKMMRERNDEDPHIIPDLMTKLGDAGLNVPEEKLTKTFKILSELSDNTREALLFAEKLRSNKSNQEKKIEAEKSVSEAFIKLLVARALFERFESVLEDVETLQSERNSIWDNFKKYEETVNCFLNNKYFRITKDGNFEVRSGARKIELENLSSGEKHIIAILGRAALTKDSGSIFIADEPELSLHLTWQRMMLPSILALSPKSQIIVATHSPAIIPKDANKIDLGACL